MTSASSAISCRSAASTSSAPGRSADADPAPGDSDLPGSPAAIRPRRPLSRVRMTPHPAAPFLRQLTPWLEVLARSAYGGRRGGVLDSAELPAHLGAGMA